MSTLEEKKKREKHIEDLERQLEAYSELGPYTSRQEKIKEIMISADKNTWKGSLA